MVNVSDKNITQRIASAEGKILIPKLAYDLICETPDVSDADLDDDARTRKRKAKSKGDVCSVAQLAGIMCVSLARHISVFIEHLDKGKQADQRSHSFVSPAAALTCVGGTSTES